MAEPEQTPPPQAQVEVPAVEAPVQTSGVTPAEAEPAIQSSNSYRYQPMSAPMQFDPKHRWELLGRLAPTITRFIMESEIVFDIISIDLEHKSFTANFPNIKAPVILDNPTTIYIIDSGYYYDRLKAGGYSAVTLFNGIYIRNDATFPNVTYFTNMMAEELYHRWDSLNYPGGQFFWYLDYISWPGDYNSNPFEIKAKNYANDKKNYPVYP